ncbi:MAG: sensor histidine kinase [Acidobacteria bacterium]|nr:sensor histidine kinase [Acidobacteriota bacterium]
MAMAALPVNARPVLEAAGLPILVNLLFWDSGSLLTSLIIGLLGFVWFAYRLRVAQLSRRHAQQEAFSRQLIASQESERKRIAAELHDGLSQSLVIIKSRALSSLNAPGDYDRAFEQLREIAEAASQVIDDLNEIVYDLSPIQLDRLGLTGAIEDLLDNVADSHALKITRELDDIAGWLPKEAETNLYRIVQESVNNILKHAEAGEITVKVKRGPGLIELTIKDDGKGFVPGEAQTGSRKGGFGLTGVIERTRLLGGAHLIESTPGRGTTISIKLSLKEKNNGR